ncbi:MAG TPA: hypothetical protein PKV72_01395 [Candidatus Peribacteria bacterium]|nr:hypothetical protein [Candidatus Peribacteria bacterium]
MDNAPRPPEPHRIEQLRDVCGQLSQAMAALTTAEQDEAAALLRERVAGYRVRLAALGVTADAADRIFAEHPLYYLNAELYAESMASRLLAAAEEEIPTRQQFRAHVGEHTDGTIRLDTLANVLQPEYAAPASSQAVIRRYQHVVGVLTATAISLGALQAVRGALAAETRT